MRAPSLAAARAAKALAASHRETAARRGRRRETTWRRRRGETQVGENHWLSGQLSLPRAATHAAALLVAMAATANGARPAAPSAGGRRLIALTEAEELWS